MSKKKVILVGPVLNISGYSDHARIVANSLLEMDSSVDLYILPTQWANSSTSLSYEKMYAPLIRKTQLLLANSKDENDNVAINEVFDISIQVKPPNEFEKMADINIGITAALETTFAPEIWIDKCNAMDHIIVPSEHCRKNLKNAKSGLGSRISTPISVIPHSYNPKIEKENVYENIEFETSFNFLSMFQLAPRKNYEFMLKCFLEEFKDDEDVGLVIKSHALNNSTLDFFYVKQRFEQLINMFCPERKCKVYITHGNLSEGQIQGYYDKDVINCYITTAHGEGFGIPLLHASCNDIPIIAPAWSGYLDFLRMPVKNRAGKLKIESKFLKVDYKVDKVREPHLMPDLITPDCEWAYPDEASFKKNLRKIKNNHKPHAADAEQLGEHNREKFSLLNVVKMYQECFSKKLLDASFTDEISNEIVEL